MPNTQLLGTGYTPYFPQVTFCTRLCLCLGTEAAGVSVPPCCGPGASADEYNRDRNDAPFVTVARRRRSSTRSLSLPSCGGLGVTPAAGELFFEAKNTMVFRGLPQDCWRFWFSQKTNLLAKIAQQGVRRRQNLAPAHARNKEFILTQIYSCSTACGNGNRGTENIG